uniref:Lysine (K)-specific demethylase 7Ab n=1 Tax=Callorhinchus milii TaxID=7868 RepID=A0A4W3GR36_CALMI
MIECDVCKDWFHGSCVRVEEHQAVDIDLYHCPNCAALHGVSLMRKRKNWHRHDYTEVDEHVKPVQAGTSVFVRELQARSFPSADEIIIRMHGAQLTQKYLEKHGFEFPIMLSKIDGLGISLPPNNFSVREVEEYVGGDKVIDVIDVARQADSKMKLHDFVKYYTDPHRNKVLNVISLEFSDTKMAELVEVPDIVKKLSWVENYWPEDSFFPKPYVQKYCLMGVKDSYTDFHIDFGGTSVWYHVLWGEKIFYLIKPTNANLALYESWSSSVNQSEVFFGDRVDRCYKCVVRQGNTLLIPTGTVRRGLYGQAGVVQPDCGFCSLLFQMDNCQPQNYMVEGIKYLIPALKSWIQKEVLMEHTYEIPDQIRPGQLIKELDKEIRFLEDMSIGSKPVKSQGIVGTMPIMRVSQDKSCSFSVSPGKRRIRRLRDPSNKVHSDLDILELHTREVLKKMEMAQWGEEDVSNSKFKMKISRTSQPSSTVPEKNPNDNNLRLVLSNGRIIRYVLLFRNIYYTHMYDFVFKQNSSRIPGSQPSLNQSLVDEQEQLYLLLFPLCFCYSRSHSPTHTPSLNGDIYLLKQVKMPKLIRKECSAATSHKIQENKNFMEELVNREWWTNTSESITCTSGAERIQGEGRLNDHHSRSLDHIQPISPPMHPSSKRALTNPPPVSNQATKGKRPKKGMATAKQRLGKILKLNRSGRLFL